MNTRLHPQLTMHVDAHPESVREDRELYLVGSVKIAGAFTVDRDLQAGDELTVTIANADGEVIAKGLCTAKAPKFDVIDMDHTIKVEK